MKMGLRHLKWGQNGTNCPRTSPHGLIASSKCPYVPSWVEYDPTIYLLLSILDWAKDL